MIEAQVISQPDGFKFIEGQYDLLHIPSPDTDGLEP